MRPFRSAELTAAAKKSTAGYIRVSPVSFKLVREKRASWTNLQRASCLAIIRSVGATIGSYVIDAATRFLVFVDASKETLRLRQPQIAQAYYKPTQGWSATCTNYAPAGDKNNNNARTSKSINIGLVRTKNSIPLPLAPRSGLGNPAAVGIKVGKALDFRQDPEPLLESPRVVHYAGLV